MTLTELLAECGVSFRHVGESPHVTHGWLGIECPWCGKGTGKYGLGINLEWGNCSCWKCGPKRLGEVLTELTGRPWRELRKLLGEFDRRIQRKRPPQGVILPDGLAPLSTCHRNYLRQRNFDPNKLTRLWGLKGLGLTPRLCWRIFIPVVLHSETISWTTRSISDSIQTRYITARPEEEALPAKTLLYGEDYVRHTAVVCEGPTDVWRVGPGAVATLGVGWSRAQVIRLALIPVRVVCFDKDQAAQRRAVQLCRELACFPGRTERVVLDAPDPGSASTREIARLRKMYLE